MKHIYMQPEVALLILSCEDVFTASSLSDLKDPFKNDASWDL